MALWDIHSIMFGGIPNMEIESLRKYWDAFPGLREEIFGNISDNYARVIADDIESAVSNFASVSNYIAKYHSSFSGFGEYLKDCLIEDILDVNAQSLKENICIDIFNRTTNIKLIDQYKAFQILSENWETITADLEMIQGEGFLLKADIAKSRKKELRKLMVFFADVTPIDLYSVNWNLQYNRNNQSYQMLISICYLVVKGLLQTNTDGTTKLMDFLDEQRMCRLYAKFILEYYKKHYPKLTVSASHIPWALDDGIGDMLPVMQSDIHFQKENTVLIIDAKYYTNTTQVQFDKHTLHSNNLYQIFTYVKNREYQFGDEENKVSGMLLYARTDALIQPDNVYQMHGNQISVKTLDLNKPFDEIAKQLDEIAAAHFDGIEKTI